VIVFKTDFQYSLTFFKARPFSQENRFYKREQELDLIQTILRYLTSKRHRVTRNNTYVVSFTFILNVEAEDSSEMLVSDYIASHPKRA
jgi:transposase